MMNSAERLIRELEETNVAKEVGIEHDNARNSYLNHRNTVKDMYEFEQILSDYVNYHISKCVSKGGRMSPAEAVGLAREILDQEFRRRGGDFITAYNNAHDGVDGGLRTILDILAEGIKALSVERFIRHTFDRYVAPNDWDQKVQIIREFFEHCGTQLSSSIQTDKPERYASSYFDVIRSFLEAMRRTSSVFRRL
jgi:hypothetical protein